MGRKTTTQSLSQSVSIQQRVAWLFSDDMLIKLWDWEKKWVCTQVFEGHTHYVMQIVINPKDNNTFASCSLDRTVKVSVLAVSHCTSVYMGIYKTVSFNLK